MRTIFTVRPKRKKMLIAFIGIALCVVGFVLALLHSPIWFLFTIAGLTCSVCSNLIRR